MREIETLLFERFANDVDVDKLPLVFILGAPRTGSTLIYQILINFFGFFYFSNFINDYFSEFPVIGAALELSLNPDPDAPVSYQSEYGKTEGLFGPSEGSLIFRNWFGGEHPSQINSCKVLPGKATHFIATMKSVYKLIGRPVLTKNAWNCFRIQDLTRLFPNTHFVWIRRDMGLSALSDLRARYARGGSTVWNSATTANYQDIQKRPYWEQVVEQQYEYNESIAKDLSRCSQGRYIELWYEDLCENTRDELEKLDQYFISKSFRVVKRDVPIPSFCRSSKIGELADDYTKIVSHISGNSERYGRHVYAGARV
jgi:hypothetical protein